MRNINSYKLEEEVVVEEEVEVVRKEAEEVEVECRG
jgi:hypothetical protein